MRAFTTNKWLRRSTYAIGVCLILGAILLITCNIIVAQNRRFVLAANSTVHAHIGIVLGAGITAEGTPYQELRARLDVAATGIETGQVDGLILSGDNSRKTYDEPQAMLRYLVDVKHIPASKLQVDDAGLDTYASCNRARKIYTVQRVVIYSAPSHVPRAIFLCRQLGVEAWGVSSGVDGSNASRREPVAAVKAVLNVTLFPEHTILGPPIVFNPR